MAKKEEVSEEGSYGSYDGEDDEGSVEDLAGRIKNDDSHESEQEEKPAPKEKKSLDDKEKQAAEERKKKKRIEQLDKRIKMLMKRKEKDR
jgi:hypothetical protein